MSIVSKENTAPYSWGGVCSCWRLVRHEALGVIEERMPAGATETTHHHRRARQFFYVLQGRLSMEVDGAVQHVPARHGLEIPPEVRHRAFNEGPEEVEFLLVSVPPTDGDRINHA
jgi:mannose-6-phosphate isomerase-like protein (cupin superfamily)